MGLGFKDTGSALNSSFTGGELWAGHLIFLKFCISSTQQEYESLFYSFIGWWHKIIFAKLPSTSQCSVNSGSTRMLGKEQKQVLQKVVFDVSNEAENLKTIFFLTPQGSLIFFKARARINTGPLFCRGVMMRGWHSSPSFVGPMSFTDWCSCTHRRLRLIICS